MKKMVVVIFSVALGLSLVGAITYLAIELDQCSVRCAERDIELARLEQQLARLRQQYAQLEEENLRLEEEVNRRERENRGLALEAVQLERSLSRANATSKELASRINAAIELANRRVLFLTEIPDESTLSAIGWPYESEYERLRGKYNDLVGRFNAAIERNSELAQILIDAIAELEG